MSEPDAGRARFVALQDRAYAFVAEHQPVAEPALLAHTYGGLPPAALHATLAAPLLDDPRLERNANRCWAVVGRQSAAVASGGLPTAELTTLALAASGPSPSTDRARLVHVTAEHLRAGVVVERFDATLNPGGRVPLYVTERLGLAPGMLDDLPGFASIADDLVEFLGSRPVVAQDARLTWAFVEAEMRRIGRVVVEPLLVDANAIATHLLDLAGKPSLVLVAAQLGIGTVRIARPDEEARVLSLVTTRLLALAAQRGLVTWEALLAACPGGGEQTALLRSQTARALPDEPGVYVLRSTDQAPLYIGKARRLRSRLEAYVHRPLGATRRLEGLVGSVEAVDSTVCATDLEALILEDREIRRLQPRFNTVRQQRAPRLWIRLPPSLADKRRGGEKRAPRRLEASLGPATAEGEFVGPFRNEMLAEQTRLLVRQVYDLDTLRRTQPLLYADRLAQAWAFLAAPGPDSVQNAEAFARQRSRQLLRGVLAFDLAALLLPADPRLARYAVVRPARTGIEAFLIDGGILRGWSVLDDDADVHRLATALLAEAEPRTAPQDVDIVLRWMGAQRPPARLVHLAADPVAAGDAIEDAALGLLDRLLEA